MNYQKFLPTTLFFILVKEFIFDYLLPKFILILISLEYEMYFNGTHICLLISVEL